MPKKRIVRAAKSWVTYLVLAIVAAAAYVLAGSGPAALTAAVERRTVSAVIDVTGSVVPVSSAGLGFEQGGRVSSLPAREGTRVAKGQLLAALDSSALYADLQDAEATLAIRRAESGNTTESVEAVEAAQDTLVENAYRTLLSEGLEFRSVSVSETAEPPAISGRYSGREGTYKLRLYRSADGDLALKVFGLDEGLPEVEIRAANRAVPFGSHGLFLTLEELASYRGTDWTLEIPNRASAEYPTNLAAYEAALRERDRAVQQAREGLGGGADSIDAARIAQAEAGVARVRADIAARAIHAPFSGFVKSVDVELGEIASASAAVITLISDGAFQVEANLPEIDSTRVRPGMVALVTVGALGDGSTFVGKVAKVDRAESKDGSVPVYKMTVFLDEPPAELRSGMTADVVVEVASSADTLAVPLAAVELAGDGDFVSVLRDGEATRVPVSLGLRGDDGYVEVSGALAAGDLVVLPTR